MGVEPMRELPAAQSRPAGRCFRPKVLSAMLTRSLLLYLAADVMHRTWVVLNSDVAELIRRIH